MFYVLSIYAIHSSKSYEIGGLRSLGFCRQVPWDSTLSEQTQLLNWQTSSCVNVKIITAYLKFRHRTLSYGILIHFTHWQTRGLLFSASGIRISREVVVFIIIKAELNKINYKGLFTLLYSVQRWNETRSFCKHIFHCLDRQGYHLSKTS
jgi:hypothetical protein